MPFSAASVSAKTNLNEAMSLPDKNIEIDKKYWSDERIDQLADKFRKVSIVPLSYMMYSPSGMNTKGTMIRWYFSIVSDINGIEDSTRLSSQKIIMPIANTSNATRVCDQSNEVK